MSNSTWRSIEYQHSNSHPSNGLNDVVIEWLKWNPNRRWIVNAMKSVDKNLV